VITVEEKGKTKQKAWRSWARLGPEAKGLIQFQDRGVKGVGLLTLSHANHPSEQWFYTAAIDRDRRVAKQEKSTRFLGTHFTYEDMEERDVAAYAYARLEDETPFPELRVQDRSGARAHGKSQYSSSSSGCSRIVT